MVLADEDDEAARLYAIIADYASSNFVRRSAMARLLHTAALLVRAAELALPTEDYDTSSDTELDFLAHSRSLGRVSAMSMLGYFALGPYVNLTMLDNPPLPSYGFPILGGGLMVLMMLKPKWFKWLSVVFTGYTILILYLTA